MPSSTFHGSVIPMAQWLPVSRLDAQHGKCDYLTRTRHKVNGALLRPCLGELWLWEKAAVGCELWKSYCGL